MGFLKVVVGQREAAESSGGRVWKDVAHNVGQEAKNQEKSIQHQERSQGQM